MSIELENTSTETNVDEPLPEVKRERKAVDFLADVESKALVEAIKPAVEDFKIDNVMEVLPKIIKHVQRYRNLTGPEKKNMIIAMLKHLVDITDGPGDDDLWDPIIKRLIPSMVDTLVQVDKGKLKLNTKKGGLFGLFKCCC